MSAALAVCGLTLPAFGFTNSLELNNPNIAPGTKGTVTLNLVNTDPCYGFQVDLTLPAGLTIEEAKTTDRTEGGVMTVNKESGKERLVFVSLPNSLAGNTGAVCQLTLNAASTFQGGYITMTDGKLSDGGLEDLALPETQGYVSALSVTKAGISNFALSPNETATVPFELTTKGSVSGFQADITIPEGLTVDPSSVKLSARAAGFKLKTESISGGLRVVVYSTSGALLSGESGSIFTLDVAAEETALGKLQMTATGIRVADAAGVSVPVADVKTTVSVSEILVTAITLDVTEGELLVGGELEISATVEPANASFHDVTWSVSDESIATVTDGMVTAVGAGEVTVTATAHNGLEAECKLRVWMPGDTNGDDSTDVADVVNAVNYIAGLPVENFVEIAGEFNGDGEITVTDAVQIAFLVVNDLRMNTAPRANVAKAGGEADEYLKVNSDGQSVDLALVGKGYTAFQALVHLPEGMKIDEVTLNERYSASHTVLTSSLDESIVKVMVFSLDNSLLDGDETPVLHMRGTSEAVEEMPVVDGVKVSDKEAHSKSLDVKYENNGAGLKEILASGKVTVKSVAGGIEINGAEGMWLNVVSADGKSVVSGTVPSYEEAVGLEAGLYIININGYAVKLVVK